MIHFENLYFLLLLVPVLALWALHLQASRRNAQAREWFGAASLWQRLAPHFSPLRGKAKFALTAFSLILLVLGISGLRKASRTEIVQRKGCDVLLALDVSRSMWAQDIKPNRFERAQQFALKLIDALRGDRIGLIFFAGQAYLQMPMTVDYSAARLLVRTASPKIEIMQGTAMEEAMQLAIRLGEQSENKKQRALVFITDGENHEDRAASKAQEARSKGISTFVVGVGTEEGAPIPLPSPGGVPNYQADRQGNTVQSKMNAELMGQIASAGGGRFFPYSPTQADAIISELQGYMSNLDKETFEEQVFDRFEPYFFWFAIPALLLLVIEFLLSYRKPEEA